MRLGELRPPAGSKRAAKRLGQGTGSGTGKTSGRGHKGARSRSGATRGSRVGFEGGQMPLHRRLPKIGFSNALFRKTYQVVNVGSIDALGIEGEIGPDELKRAGLVRKTTQPIKILGEGELTKKVKLRAHAFSASAAEKIGKAGGEVELIGK